MDSSNIQVGGSSSQNGFGKNDAEMEMQAAMVAQQIANPPEPPRENMMATVPASKKGGKGSLIAMVFFAILAVGGVGFGVWSMMDKDSQVDALNKTVSDLKGKNNELEMQIETLNDTITNLRNEIANNSNNSGNNDNNQNNNVPPEEDKSSNIVADYSDDGFYLKDGNGNVLAHDNGRVVTGIISCENGTAEESSTLKCVVMTLEGEGFYIYNRNNNTLSFTLTGEPE